MTTESPEAGHDMNDKNEAGSDKIVGIIQGDRVCLACGFNLCGQRIVREPRYNLLIARCPECGQAAALQEYPLLGRWVNRWAATLAGTWLVLYLALSIGCGMAIFGLAVGTTEINSDVVARQIDLAHSQSQPAKNPGVGFRMSRAIDQGWWESADQAGFIASTGGVRLMFWRAANTTWLGLLFAMIPIGCLASIALRRRCSRC